METQTKNFLKYFLIPLIITVGLVFYYDTKNRPDSLLHIDFFNIGQGDAYLITTYSGNQILVDGGPGNKILEQLGQELGPFDKTLDMIILSHPHLDHFEGLTAVLNRYVVKRILMPNVDVKNDAYNLFLKAVIDEQAEVIFALQGQRIFLDSATTLDIMYPSSQQIKPKKSDDLNDTSIVAKLSFGRTSMLLTGDSGINIEEILLPMFDLDVDLLKVGHHGSKHSTSAEFLKEVTPKYSVMQLGENKYGHPASETMDHLKAADTQIFRTDQNQPLEFVSDGILFRRIGE